MSYPNLTKENFIAALMAAVAERPTFVYRVMGEPHGCTLYPTLHKPSRCLIGEALSRCGIPDTDMTNEDVFGFSGSGFIKVHLGERICNWASEIQHRQDNGATWQEALNYGTRYILMEGQ